MIPNENALAVWSEVRDRLLWNNEAERIWMHLKLRRCTYQESPGGEFCFGEPVYNSGGDPTCARHALRLMPSDADHILDLWDRIEEGLERLAAKGLPLPRLPFRLVFEDIEEEECDDNDDDQGELHQGGEVMACASPEKGEPKTMTHQENALALVPQKFNQVEEDFLTIKATFCFYREEEGAPLCRRPGFFESSSHTGRFCPEHAPIIMHEMSAMIAEQWRDIKAACRWLVLKGLAVPELPIELNLDDDAGQLRHDDGSKAFEVCDQVAE